MGKPGGKLLVIGLVLCTTGCFGGNEGEAGGSGSQDAGAAGTSPDPDAGQDGARRRGNVSAQGDAATADVSQFGKPLDAGGGGSDAGSSGSDSSGMAAGDGGAEGGQDAGGAPATGACPVPGLTQTGCACASGGVGSRRCETDLTWSACTCAAPIDPTPCSPGQQVVCVPCAGESEGRTVTCADDGTFDCSCKPFGRLGAPCPDAGCGSGTVCSDGLCTTQCSGNSGCILLESAAICFEGQCSLACTDAAQCPAGTLCAMDASASGTCQLAP